MIAQALLWSCHEHGVRTVEFQHGLNGYYHFGYTHWTSVPPDGYATLPDVFLTWGESSANNIRRWLPGNGPSCPAVVVGGRLDFLPPSGPASGALGDALSAARANHDKIILVTLSQGLDIVYGLAPVLVEMMLKAPRSWFWLIRAHPRSINEDKGSKDKERYRMFVPWGVDEHLRGQGLSNFETALASAAPLLPLLSQIDHHVTGVSSCYLEAAAMNVPTSFFHVLARVVWNGYLVAGLALYADTAVGVIATIAGGWHGLRQAGHAAITNNDALAESTIRYLLAPPTATGQTPQAWIPGASRLA